MDFIQREQEINEIRRQKWLSVHQRSRMLLICGRPLTGKKATVLEALKGSEILLLHIGGKAWPLQMLEFAGVVKSVLKEDLPEPCNSLSSLFEFLLTSGRKDLTLVIDGFDEIAKHDFTEYNSIARVWNKYRAATNLNVVLCMSSHTMLENLFLKENSPMYNCLDSYFQMNQLPLKLFKETMLSLNGEAGPYDILTAWSMTGGLPEHISFFVDNGIVREEEMVRAYFSPSSPFIYRQNELLLSLLGKNSGLYLSILQLLSQGYKTQRSIESVLGTNIGGHLSKLESDYDLVHKERPAFSDSSSRNVRYNVKDIELEFWLRYVESNRQMVEGGDYEEVRSRFLSDRTDWNHIAMKRYFTRKLQEETSFQYVCGWWKGDCEMDLVAWSDNRKRALVADAFPSEDLFDSEEYHNKVNSFKLMSGRASGIDPRYLTPKDI